MGIVKFGGFVVTMDGGTYVGTNKKGVDKETFRKVAEVLGIPRADVDRLMDHQPRSIHIYSGTENPPFSSQAGSGSGGSGSGGE